MNQHPLLKEYLDIIFRRRWWILLPSLVGVLCAVALFFKFPKLYGAETRVQIRAQEISPRIFTPIVETNISELISDIRAQVFTEKYATQLESRLNLIGTPGGPRDITDLLKTLDNRVVVDLRPRERYFSIQVTWGDPMVAASVANEIANIYIQESKNYRKEMAGTTLAQLAQSRENVEKQLNDLRAEITQFMALHKLELPNYQQNNLETIRNNREESQREDDRIRDHQTRIKDIELRLSLAQPVANDATRDPRLDQLERLRQQRQSREAAGMKPEHPTMQALIRQIETLEKDLARAPGGNSAAAFSRAQLEQERQNLLTAIDAARARQQRLAAENTQIQGRMDRTPEWQSRLDQMQQREKALADQFQDALSREQRAIQGKEVEDYSQGERFEFLTKARPVTKPVFPDLRMFLALGLVIGGGLGVFSVLILEVFDQSFKSEEQLAGAVDLPILAVIPDLTRMPHTHKKRQRRSEKGSR